MKVKYTLILLILFSCAQKAKIKEVPKVKTIDVVDLVEDTLHKVSFSSFDKTIDAIKRKPFPVNEATNFDSFIEEGDYDNVNVEVLKLEEVYPNFYVEGYNYRAISNYRLKFSDSFHSAVVTVLKGDHEMESVLINYDLDGKLIDSKVVSYDEIAEGRSSIKSKIEDNKLTISNILWVDDKKETIEIFEIENNGKVKLVVPNNSNTISENTDLIDLVIQQLNLSKEKIKTDFLVSKILPSNSKETIVIIPEIVDEDSDQYDFLLKSHLLIVDSNTGKIKNQHIESWQSDAIILEEVVIDSLSYMVSNELDAFGILSKERTMSQPNPYYNESLSLYIKSGDSLKKILNYYEVNTYSGEWDTVCAGEFTDIERTLSMSETMTNGYYDILVKSKIKEVESFVGENGDCQAKDTITTKYSVLRFNTNEYK